MPSTSTHIEPGAANTAVFQSSTKSLIPLSPCTETTDKSLSVSATFELKETDDRPLVVL